MLWNRSLIMEDIETESHWSHLLGKAMAGKLKGETLDSIPSDMMTWKAWKKLHPKTDVLNMSRTHRNYTKEFYRNPSAFALGFVLDDQAYHATFAMLKEQPILNIEMKEQPLLLTFDADSTAARLFSRKVGKQVLTFKSQKAGTMRDKETASIWNATTGQALSGKLKDQLLTAMVGIPTFTKAWTKFHPASRAINK